MTTGMGRFRLIPGGNFQKKFVTSPTFRTLVSTFRIKTDCMIQHLTEKISFIIGHFIAFIREENLKTESLILMAVLFFLLLVV